jgi:predicted MFS family arabinose efflux permease
LFAKLMRNVAGAEGLPIIAFGLCFLFGAVMGNFLAAAERTSATTAVLLACILIPIGFFAPPGYPPEVLFGLAVPMLAAWLVYLGAYLVRLRPGKTKKC